MNFKIIVEKMIKILTSCNNFRETLQSWILKRAAALSTIIYLCTDQIS